MRHPYPGEYGAEAEEDGPQDVRPGVAVLPAGLGPRHAHDEEGDGVEEGPERGEAHVSDHVVLAGLDGGHLFKEPEKRRR